MVLMLPAEVVCTEKNQESKLCRKVESLSEQLTVLPQLKKRLKEQENLLASTSDTIMTLSRALKKLQDHVHKASGEESEIKHVLLNSNAMVFDQVTKNTTHLNDLFPGW